MKKTVKNLVNKGNNLLLVAGVSFSNMTNAAGSSADDVFQPLNEKGSDIAIQLVNAAAILSLIAIVGFGIAVMFGKISKVWGLSILAGCTIIFSASTISSYLMG